jgi:Transglutaminase-like superfamily
MWKAFQRYRALDPESRGLFWKAVKLFSLIAVSLRFRGFKKTKEALQARLPGLPLPTVEKENAAATVQKTCRMVSAAAHYGVLHPTCLVESLALWYLLQIQGVPASLRIGVRKLSEKFEAHAWVEFKSTALNQAEEAHRHYAAFDSGFSDLPGDQP